MFKAVEFDNTAQERIKEAANLERRLRLEALIGIESEIGGIKIRQMTGFDVLQLQYAENKIIIGGVPDETDFAHFFWLLRSKSEERNQVSLFKVILKKLKNSDFIQSVYTYVDHCFIDLPKSSSNTLSSRSYNANPSVWLTGIIDSLASEYGWKYEDIMSSPLPRTLQLYQYLLKRQLGDKYKIRNPLTQKASAKELNKIRNQNG
tara:strand:+ start:333 stop:947 length:615 start_codon:yes stop_codon:yes gene_type:complete